jgi:hypothetical protein
MNAIHCSFSFTFKLPKEKMPKDVFKKPKDRNKGSGYKSGNSDDRTLLLADRLMHPGSSKGGGGDNGKIARMVWEDEKRTYVPTEGLMGKGAPGWTKSGWIELDVKEMLELLDLTDNHPYMKIAMKMDLTDLLAGPIHIQREGKDLSPEAARWNSERWTHWLSHVVRMYVAWGFAFVTFVPHPVFGWEPRELALPPTARVMYRKTLAGKPKYAIMVPKSEIDDDSLPVIGNTDMVFVPNAFAFTQDAPNEQGRLVSVAATVSLVLFAHESMKLITLKAIVQRSNPRIITEALPEEKGQVDDILNNLQRLRTESKTVTETEDDSIKMARADHFARLANSMGTRKYQEAVRKYYMPDGSGGMFGERYDLPKGRKYVKASIPEAPPDALPGELHLQQVVFMLFTLPPSVIQAESTRGRLTRDTSAENLLSQHRMQMRRQGIQLITEYFFILWAQTFRDHRIVNAGLGEPLNLAAAMRFTITMPGIPPPEVVDQLYHDGFLKYEALINYKEASYSIPKEFFHRTPQLTLKEFRGQEPKQAPGGAAKQKPKAKAKPKGPGFGEFPKKAPGTKEKEKKAKKKPKEDRKTKKKTAE